MPTPEQMVNAFAAASYRLGCVSLRSVEKVRAERDVARAALITALEEGERAKAEVARLREAAKGQLVVVHHAKEAIADRDRLAAEVERLRGALDAVREFVRTTEEALVLGYMQTDVPYVERIRSILSTIDLAGRADRTGEPAGLRGGVG